MAEENKKNITTAKSMSKIFKVISVLGIIICHILKWCKLLDAPSGEICMMWAVVYGLGAGTIDFNIMLDKFRKPNEKE